MFAAVAVPKGPKGPDLALSLSCPRRGQHRWLTHAGRSPHSQGRLRVLALIPMPSATWSPGVHRGRDTEQQCSNGCFSPFCRLCLCMWRLSQPFPAAWPGSHWGATNDPTGAAPQPAVRSFRTMANISPGHVLRGAQGGWGPGCASPGKARFRPQAPLGSAVPGSAQGSVLPLLPRRGGKAMLSKSCHFLLPP